MKFRILELHPFIVTSFRKVYSKYISNCPSRLSIFLYVFTSQSYPRSYVFHLTRYFHLLCMESWAEAKKALS